MNLGEAMRINDWNPETLFSEMVLDTLWVGDTNLFFFPY